MKVDDNYEVLLINPSFGHRGMKIGFNLPINLLELGSYLSSKGVKVKIIDCAVKENYIGEIKKYMKSVILVGFGVMTVQIASALRITEHIKSLDKNVKFVWGGVHPTLYPKQTIENALVDFVIVGEGEKTLYALYKSLKNRTSYRNIGGLMFKSKVCAVYKPKKELLDLESLPSPNWDLIDKEIIERYRNANKDDAIQIVTGRGCPHRCTFCINSSTGNRWRGKSAERIVEEVSYLYNNLNIKNIRFRDECFFVDKRRIKEVLKGLIKNNIDINWTTTCRVDYFTKGVIDEDILKLMEKTHCYKLYFGVESGSERIIKMIKKDISLNDVFIATEKCIKYGIKSSHSFMIGMPYETKDDMFLTLKLIKKLDRLYRGNIEIIGPQPYRPYPGGEMYGDALNLGLNEPQLLEDWQKVYSDMDISISSKNFKWIEDPDFVDNIWIYIKFSVGNWRGMLTSRKFDIPKIFFYLFSVWCRIKIALGLYNNFLELRLIKKIYKGLQSHD